jgi:hypothetical protein
MAQFITLPSGIILNLDTITAVQLVRHDGDGHVRHGRLFTVGTSHKEAFELGREDVEFFLEHLRERKLITEAEYVKR